MDIVIIEERGSKESVQSLLTELIAVQAVLSNVNAQMSALLQAQQAATRRLATIQQKLQQEM